MVVIPLWESPRVLIKSDPYIVAHGAWHHVLRPALGMGFMVYAKDRWLRPLSPLVETGHS